MGDAAPWMGFTWQVWLTLAVVVGVLLAFIMDLGSPEQVMLGGLVVLLLSEVIDLSEAFSGFSNPAMLSVASLFVVAAAVRKTGALAFLGRVMKPRSSRMAPALTRIMLPSSFFSGLMNNTPIVAVLAPMVQKWGREAGISASKLLLPLSHATILGGMCTLVGTSTNLIVSGLLAENSRVSGTPGQEELGMFELAWVGLPACLLGLAYYATVGHRLLPERQTEPPASRQDLRSYQFELSVNKDSPLAYRTVEKAGLRALKGAFLAHIQRRGEILGPVGPGEILEPDDLLTFIGNPEVLDSLLNTGGLTRVIDPVLTVPDEQRLPLFEAVLSAESSLVGRSLKDADFRERFQAAVLGIHRAEKRLEGPLGTSTLQAGDLLLLEARRNFESRWVNSGEFYLVAPLERSEPQITRKAPWVLSILVTMVLLVSFEWLPMASAALGAAVLVVAVGGLSSRDARKSVDLSILVVIASAFGIGRAIEQTGLAHFAAGQLVEVADVLGPIGVLAAVYLMTNVLTEVLTNNVAAVLLFPIGLAAADEINAAGESLVNPRAFAAAIAIAASASFSTPIGYQTNLMVMGPGGYRFRDYLRVGLPLNFLVMVLAVGIISRVWLYRI